MFGFIKKLFGIKKKKFAIDKQLIIRAHNARINCRAQEITIVLSAIDEYEKCPSRESEDDLINVVIRLETAYGCRT